MPLPDAPTAAAHLPPLDLEAPERVETATFGMGCFWGPEAAWGARPGVVRTRVGYAGGTTENPTYRQLGNHTEVVQIDFDPERLAYEDVLRLFWEGHNPSRRRTKRQYRSLLLPATDAQEEAARASKKRHAEATGRPVRTDVERLSRFYMAEDYHQKYRLRRDELLREEFEGMFGGDDEALRESPAVARANGYAAGHGMPEQLEREIGKLGLSEGARRHLRQRLA